MKGFLIALAVAAGASLGFRFTPPEIREREVIVETPEKERDFSEHLTEAARAYGVPLLVARAMVNQESGGKMSAIRYEPGQVEIAKKISKASGDQLRQYASSHCALQVMGYNTKRFNLTWSDLYNPRTCAEVGMAMMRDCMDRQKGGNALKRTFGALKCYNGGEEYARSILNKIGEQLLIEALDREMKQ